MTPDVRARFATTLMELYSDSDWLMFPEVAVNATSRAAFRLGVRLPVRWHRTGRTLLPYCTPSHRGGSAAVQRRRRHEGQRVSTVTLNVDMDGRCACGKRGVVNTTGLCMTCVSRHVVATAAAKYQSRGGEHEMAAKTRTVASQAKSIAPKKSKKK